MVVALRSTHSCCPRRGWSMLRWAGRRRSGTTRKLGQARTQGTGSKQPTRTATDAAYNNQATVSFASGSAQCMQTAAFASTIAQVYTIWIIGETGKWVASALRRSRRYQPMRGIHLGDTARAYAGAFLNAVSAGSAKNILIVEVNGRRRKSGSPPEPRTSPTTPDRMSWVG